MKNFKNIIYILGGALVGISMAYVVSYAIAFTEPGVSPPGGSVSAPLNVSSAGQAKIGSLILNTGGASNGLIVDQGRVGIGTTGPNYQLEVQGQINASDALCIREDCRTNWPGGGEGGAGDNDWLFNSVNGVTHQYSGVTGNVGIGTTEPNYSLDVQNGRINASDGLCIGGDCRTSWPGGGGGGGLQGRGTAGRIAKFINQNALGNSQIRDNGDNVGIAGAPDSFSKLNVVNDRDHMLSFEREKNGATLSRARFRLGTDGALVLDSNGKLTLKLDDHSVFSYANLYAWNSQSNGAGVGLGELQTMVNDFPGAPVYGLGWLAETGQIGALVPNNKIFGIYGASSNVAQNPAPAHFYITGDILSRDPGWTAPMRESSSGAATVSGNSMQWRWTGSEVRTKIDNTQFIVPTCTPDANGCKDTPEPPAKLKNQSDFELRCPGSEIMRGIKWNSNREELSLICTR